MREICHSLRLRRNHNGPNAVSSIRIPELMLGSRGSRWGLALARFSGWTDRVTLAPGSDSQRFLLVSDPAWLSSGHYEMKVISSPLSSHEDTI